MADVKEITKKLEEGVKQVFTSDSYKAYLSFMGRFYNYSANNCILIWLQKPEATLVAGYKAWMTKFNRFVKKGERGIQIIAPCPHKKVVENDDGSQEEMTWTSFRATTVFDISQTDGEDVPSICNDLTGDVEGYDELMKALEKVSPVPVGYEDIQTGAKGYFKLDEKRIALKEGMSELQTVKTLVHEISHAILHDKDEGEEKGADRRTKEVQAESVAYTVLQMLGLNSEEYSFEYIAGWSKDQTAKELTASMEIIRKTAKELYENIKAA